jgi:signal transduction histidine kinase
VTGLFLGANAWVAPRVLVAGLLLAYALTGWAYVQWRWRRLEETSASLDERLKRFRSESESPRSFNPRQPGDLVGQAEVLRRGFDRERALRCFLTDTLKGLPDPVLVVGLDGRVKFASREAARLFKPWAGAVLTGRPVTELTVLFSWRTHAGVALEVSRFVPGPPGGTESEALAPDGRLFSVRRAPLINRAGRTAGWIIRFADVTDRSVAARQRDQALQLLTDGICSPQSSILALLREAPATNVDAALRERITACAHKTLSLADDFVRLTRAETLPITLERTDLWDVVVEALDGLWPKYYLKGIEIKTSPDVRCFVMADRHLLSRAFADIIDYAVTNSPRNGVVDCQIEVDPGARNAVCIIKDNGAGMSAEELAKVCRAFRPGDWRTDGAGLGLAFVQAVVLRHGGRVACESELGKGAKFRITLPLAAGAPHGCRTALPGRGPRR